MDCLVVVVIDTGVGGFIVVDVKVAGGKLIGSTIFKGFFMSSKLNTSLIDVFV